VAGANATETPRGPGRHRTETLRGARPTHRSRVGTGL